MLPAVELWPSEEGCLPINCLFPVSRGPEFDRTGQTSFSQAGRREKERRNLGGASSQNSAAKSGSGRRGRKTFIYSLPLMGPEASQPFSLPWSPRFPAGVALSTHGVVGGHTEVMHTKIPARRGRDTASSSVLFQLPHQKHRETF